MLGCSSKRTGTTVSGTGASPEADDQPTTNLSFHCHIREKLKESSRTQWPDTPAAVVPQAILAQRTEKEREQ